LSEASKFGFVAADGHGEGFDRGAQVGDLVGEPGECVRFAAAGAVFLDDGAEFLVSVERGAAQAGALGDVIEGDWQGGEDEFGAGVFDAVASQVRCK